MLVDSLVRFVAEWARNGFSVAFAFVLADAMGLLWLHDRPGLRLAVVFGFAFIGAVYNLLEKPKRAQVESGEDLSS